MADFNDFNFNVIHENVISINFTEKTELRNYFDYSKLLSSALSVKNYSIFENVEIPDYEHFKPFDYQKESIKTMLEKFEGRGVFGDQVGLGKTIQVLITADIMFQNNQIKNAVIVCPKTLVDQWKNEIETKLPGRFNVIKNDDSRTVNEFENVRKLFDERLIKKDKLNVVFVDADNFKSNKTAKTEDEKIQGGVESETRIKNLEEQIPILLEKRKLEIQKNDAQIQMNMGVFSMSFEEACNALPEVQSIDEKIASIKEEIEGLKNHIIELDNDRLFNKPIDLLIIDESHKVIDQIQGSIYSKTFEQIERKYTILLSATPIEKNIDDIFNLIRFVDSNRFTDLDKFHAYVGAETLEALTVSPKAMERMNGLINSLFTRKRLKSLEVQKSLNRKYDFSILAEVIKGNKDKAYDLINEIYKDSAFREEVKNHLDKFYALSNCEEIIKEINDFIYESSYALRSIKQNPNEAVPIDNFTNPRLPFMNLLFNSYVCNYFKEKHLDFIFPFIEWSPSAKHIHNVSKDITKEKQDEYIIEKLKKDVICETSKVIIYKSVTEERIMLLSTLREAIEKRPILCDLTLSYFKSRVYSEGKSGVISSLRDDIFPYSGLPKDETDQFILDLIRLKQSSDNPEVVARELHAQYKNFVIKKFNEQFGPLSNAILLMDYTRFEGSDLHCASQLILCQKTQRILTNNKDRDEGIDPLTLEQFIGRIYRIGQPSEAHVTIFSEGDDNDELFDIYQDPEGLDLFGEGKNEIGFVVPVVVEKWVNKIQKDSSYTSYIRDFLVKPNSFVHIYMILKTMQKHTTKHNYIEEFRQSIREVCKTLAVGKKGE